MTEADLYRQCAELAALWRTEFAERPLGDFSMAPAPARYSGATEPPECDLFWSRRVDDGFLIGCVTVYGLPTDFGVRADAATLIREQAQCAMDMLRQGQSPTWRDGVPAWWPAKKPRKPTRKPRSTKP